MTYDLAKAESIVAQLPVVDYTSVFRSVAFLAGCGRIG